MRREDRFRRIELMLGRESCDRLRNAFVVVVGLGAVGSYCVEALARAGVGRLRLVDCDNVGITNINRQLYALESTLGRPKCEVARERILDINPSCQVEAIKEFVDAETAAGFLGGTPDLVIDCIDSLNPKIELLVAAYGLKLPVISSLGAAMRSDPTRVRVAPLSETNGCPLGRRVRKFLRRRGIPMDLPCVYSEEPLPEDAPIASPSDELGEALPLRRGRARNTLGSLPTITGIFGLTAANLAIGMLTSETSR